MKDTLLQLYSKQLTIMNVAVIASFAIYSPAQAQTLPGTYTTSWLGNSFGGVNSKHVPMDADSLYVAPDGTCYTNTGYEEGLEALVRYKAGDVLGLIGGQEVYGGKAIGGDGTYVYRGSGGGIRRYNLDGTDGGWSALTSDTIVGVGAGGGKVCVSDATDGKVHVFTGTTETSSFAVSNPIGVALDSGGGIWVAHNVGNGLNIAGSTVDRYNTSGTHLNSITLPNSGQAAALCVDSSGRLLIADNGPDQNVKIYTNLTSTPTLSSTFGAAGGILSGTKGATGPLKFNGLTGVGVDSTGNIYVSQNGTGSDFYNIANDPLGNGLGTVLESYTSSGTRNWQLNGMEFIDTADIDPSTETEAFTKDEHIGLDYSKGAGLEWSYKGFTLDRFTYPSDPRVNVDKLYTQAVRRVNGQKFLFLNDMYSDLIVVYRFSGETAIPCAMFTRFSHASDTYPPNHPNPGSGNGDYVWQDTNGNGQFDSGEFNLGNDYPFANGWYVDSSGNVWKALRDSSNTVYEFRQKGVDAHGSLTFDNYSTRLTFNAPAAIMDIQRLAYTASTDTMYLSGYDSSHTSTGDGGGSGGRVIYRYDNWTGTRTLHTGYPIVLNYDTSTGNGQAGFDVAGNYVFVQYYKPHEMGVYNKDTGAYAGSLIPGSAVGGQPQVGDTDIVSPVHAYLRSSGEYVVFTEEDYLAKVLMYRWSPGGTTPTAATPTFSPPGGTYTTAQSVVISDTTSGAVIHYTTDGSTPTASSATYSTAIAISSTKTIKAIAIATGYSNSAVGSATYTISTGTTEAAYNGPHNIPGTLQAEDYDTGGEGVAYHDTDTGNNGGQYRTDNVDIEATGDTGGGYNIGWIAAGEYLKYTVNVATAGSYDISFRTASGAGGGTLHLLDENNTNLTGTITVPTTGAGQTYTNVSKTGVSFTAGAHTLKLVLDSGGFNLNYIQFTASAGSSTTYQAESATLSGGVAINTNHTGYQGTGFVDSFYGTGAAVAFVVSGFSAGSHTATLRYSNGSGSAKTLSIYVNGTKIKQTTLPATTDWNTWGTVAENLTMTAGSNTIKYQFDSGDSGNVNLDQIVVQ